MIFVFIFACLTVNGISGALQPVSSSQLSGFVTSFRQTLLEKVAVETNSTVTKSELLKDKINNTCIPKLEAAIAECKLCAQGKCQNVPSFLDIIKLANPYLYLKKPLDNMSSKIKDAYDLVGVKIAPFVNSMKNLGSSIPEEIKGAFTKMKTSLESVYKSLQLHNIGDAFIDLGKIIADDFSGFGRSFTGLFNGRRRKRATIDPKARKCMEQCNACKPLLLPTEAETIASVCGKDIADANATLIAHMLKIENVYNHVVDKVNPIVTKLEVDTTTMNTNFELTEVYITWYVNGVYIRHRASAPVPFLDMATPLALEYWNNFPA